MLRAVYLIFQNEFRLLAKDRIGLFMLILAPIIIIAVAGFSLGNVYGTKPGQQAYVVPVVDEDHGAIARSVIDALAHDSSVAVLPASDLDRARAVVLGRDRAPLAVLIPAGATAAIKSGRTARVLLYVDPLKRIEVNAIEIRLNELCQRITARAQEQARRKVASQSGELRTRLERLGDQLKRLRSQMERYRDQAARSRVAAQREIKAKLAEQAGEVERETRAAIDGAIEQSKSALAGQLAARGEAIRAVNDYLLKLQASERDFDRWLETLKEKAGSRSSEIPPPPSWPAPPPREQLAELSKPLQISIPKPILPAHSELAGLVINLPSPPLIPMPEMLDEVEALRPEVAPALPGEVALNEQSLTGGSGQVNAFDQYVPGFGITFLLVGMLMGLSLGLIDDRDWGTLQRLRVSGAPLAGLLIGKLLSRFVIGVVQLVLLFAIGRLLFGISLGRSPIMLLIPAVAISFAAAAFGLVIACVARTHDSVMPVGAVVSMAMSAIGGCWWPLDFEPAWMRSIALWLPTTWTMQAFNDLTVRGLSAANAFEPAAAAAGLGLVYLIAGIAGASRLYK